MKRIIIIGSCGSGKSTLSREIGRITGIDVIHLDRYYWKNGWIETPRDEWRKVVSELVKKDSWIIDGNYSGTLEIRMNVSDTIILLNFPRLLCMFRVVKRWAMYKGKTRPDMCEGCSERLNMEFLKYVWNFHKNNSKKIFELIDKYKDGRVVYILNSPKEVKNFIRSIELENESEGL